MNTVFRTVLPGIVFLIIVNNTAYAQKRYLDAPDVKSLRKEKQAEEDREVAKKNAFQLSIFFNGNKSDVLISPRLNGVHPRYHLDPWGEPYFKSSIPSTFTIEVGVHKPIRKNFLVGGFFEYGETKVNHPGYNFEFEGNRITYSYFFGNPRVFHLGFDVKFKYRFLFVGLRGGVRANDYGASFDIVYLDQATKVDEFDSSNLGVGLYPLVATTVGVSLRLSRSFHLSLRSALYYNSDRILAEDYTVSYIGLQAGLGLIYKI